MSRPHIRIATRQSALAMWQAEYVQHALQQAHPEIETSLLPMRTQGDKILDTPLAKIGGKGLFIKELEVAMLEGRADLAVHSMKDVPVAFPDGFAIHAICPRENPFDAFVSNQFASLDALPEGAIVGTSSLRRQCQLRALRPDLQIHDLRGNVNTRLAKLDAGDYQAIILAAAGLIRLNMQDRIRSLLSSEQSLPAVGQGAVGIECRNNDSWLIDKLACLNDPATHTRVSAERALNARLQGGCQVPIGSFAELVGDTLHVRGLVGSVDGSQILRAHATGSPDNPVALGEQVADMLIANGAEALLAELHQ